MLHRHSGVPALVCVEKPDGGVELGTREVCVGKCRVVGIVKFHLRAVNRLIEHVHLRADAQVSAPEFEVEGVLQAEALVREEAELIVLEEHAHAVARLFYGKRHVRPGVHRAARVLVAHGVRLEGGGDVELRRTPCGGGVKLRLHLPVVHKRGVLLRPQHGKSACRPQQERQKRKAKKALESIHIIYMCGC